MNLICSGKNITGTPILEENVYFLSDNYWPYILFYRHKQYQIISQTLL